MKKENFHTHTKYCDGGNTPTEMIESAISKGFTALGFSGHSYLDFDCGWCMTPEGTEEYIKEITFLKTKYADKINIYCGTEQDYFTEGLDKSRYDFTIGSVHYILMDGEYLAIDESHDVQQKAADKYFGGSLIAYAVKYYETVADVLAKTGADIIGHFDLVTKFNENDIHFDTKNEEYIAAWKRAVDTLITYGKPFEINTGAIARKKRETPYPALDICDYIKSKGGKFILTSDCHNADMLDCFFDEAEKMYSGYDIIRFEEFLRNEI